MTLQQPVPGLVRLPPPLLVGLLAGAVLLAFLPTLASMARVWARSDTFAHGVLILPVCAWLLYRQRAALAATEARPCWWGLPALLACLAGWLIGSLVQADVVRQFAMMLMIPALVLLVLGPAVLRVASFPLVFALLAVPAGEFLIPPMMNLTADGSAWMLKASGVPVFQDGWLISIPSGDFQVADACSGVRYLIAAATAGLLFAYFFYRGWRKRLLFMAFVVLFTVMANVLRAYIIVLLAHWSDMRLAAGVDHFIYGWFLFSILLVVLFGVGLRFADTGTMPVIAPSARFAGTLSRRRAAFLASAGAGGVVLALGLLGSTRLGAGPGGDGQPAAAALPASLAGATLTGSADSPVWLAAGTGWAAEHLAYTGAPGFEVHVFQAGSGPGGRDLSLLRERLAGDLVVLVDEREAAVPSAAGPVPVRQMRLHEGSRDLMVAYWFDVGGARIANPVTAKIAEVRTMMQGEHKKPALIAVALDITGLDRPEDSLHAIIADLAAALADCRPAAQQPGVACDHD
ncbi:hypothetical protein GPROT2_00555 [Gammaproteobacteria bacterium]|nr:hypothetical protein GPROT2_00555 [Gammaproteobacteria bacterium]